jgi:tetratricopeptide (TPR) repeat protein
MTSRKIIFAIYGMVIFFAMGCATMNTNQEKANGHIAVGTAFMKSGQYTDALRELFIAERLTPNDPVVHYYLGIAYLGKEARDKAMMEFQKAVRLNPEYSEAHNYIGTLYLENNQWDLAIASFDRALSNILYDTPAVSLYNKGWALYKKGDYKSSIACYSQAVRMRDSQTLRPRLEKNLGLSFMAMGDYAAASAHLQTALTLVPEFAEVKYWLAVVNVRQKNYGEATKLFQELIQQAPQAEFGTKAKDMQDKLKRGKYDEVK